MKRNLPALLFVVFLGYAVVAAGQNINDPARIEVYVTPYYNSKGPTINVGPFSKGLGANSQPDFVATIAKMKQSWDTLSFPETYVAAIRLYDLGFRKEAIYSGVTFKNRSEWDTDNKGLHEGLGKLVETLKEQKASIKQQRIERGMEAKFSKLPSKELPK